MNTLYEVREIKSVVRSKIKRLQILGPFAEGLHGYDCVFDLLDRCEKILETIEGETDERAGE